MENIVLFFKNLHGKDLFDIALNSYIIFRLYIMFRGTQAFQLLTGVLFLWLFQRFAVSLNLVVTSWVLQGVTAVLALIIIVVFRSEIKRVFQARDLKAFFWSIPTVTQSSSLEAIVEAVFEMSRKNIGALIVFPGKEDISEIIQGGLGWQGLISKEMIKSIFFPGNPVHDGAAIIEGHRVRRVGVILPLSQNGNIPSIYGTRHRAALGISESSDALAVTVSEERGEVTVARAGELKTISRKSALLDQLRNHQGFVDQSGAARSGSKRTILAAVLSVVFVSGLWFSFTGGRDTLISLEVPVTFKNRKSTMEIVQMSQNAVRVHLSGSGALITSIRPEQVQVNVSLENLVQGHNKITITPGDVSIPPGIILDRVEPGVVDIVMDQLVTKEIPVQIDWTGRLDERLILSEAVVEPPTVKISGLKVAVSKIATIYTQPLPLETIQQSGTQSVEIVSGTDFSPSVGQVKIRYRVRERDATSQTLTTGS